MVNGWETLFEELENKQYFTSLKNFLSEEYKNHIIYPTKENIFQAFKLVKPERIKVIILGQDPYHEPNQAMGLAFSIPPNEPLPPSLINIYKEIEAECNIKMKKNGDLTYLARQGVLLLNTILTVRAHEPLSHNVKEYKNLMKDVFSFIDKLDQPIVFLLWGNNAKKYMNLIKNKNRLILTSAHPSPLSANRGGWFNNDHFRKTNEYLCTHKLAPIKWSNNIT